MMKVRFKGFTMLRKLKTLLSVYYAYMMEYRAELIFWVLSGSLPLILMGAWMKAAEGGNFGLSALDFVHYFVAVFLARQFTIVWVIWEFEREVIEGTLSFRLLQPLDPVWHHVVSHLAERMARLPFAVVVMAIFFLIYPQAFWMPSLSQWILAAMAVIISFSLRFTIQYTFALIAFWSERASALEELWFLVYLFLSGLIAPLEVFPPLVRSILMWTPFPYMISVPASLLVGLPVNLIQAWLVPLAWIGIVLIINRWLWKRGLREYSGMGA